jgi:GNAT superfamily N-acetyltransferase
MSDIRLVPMTEEQYRAYRATADESYARSIAETGVAWADAVEQSAKSFADLLPEGLATPGHHFWAAYAGDDEVGMLWVRIKPGSTGPHAFGFGFKVREDVRRQGYGRAIMVAAEEKCRELGVVSIGLHVFGYNAGARSLYEQMGFEVTGYNMRKTL